MLNNVLYTLKCLNAMRVEGLKNTFYGQRKPSGLLKQETSTFSILIYELGLTPPPLWTCPLKVYFTPSLIA